MIIDLTNTYQGYFAAYLKVHGIQTGDTVMFHEYSNWITDKHDVFRRMKGRPYCNGYPTDIQAEFNRFILEEVPAGEAGTPNNKRMADT